jgi:predicted nucleic acid-binding protein
MGTTIRLRDDLLRRAKKRAAEERRTLTSLVEEAVALALARPAKKHRERVELPVSRASGGVRPGVDLNRSTDLEVVPDAWFAAMAIEAGCEWVTLDRDYARFAELKWRTPG